MTENTTFLSRPAKLKCSAGQFYYFVTDIRNLKKFIPSDTFSDISINSDSCHFNAGMLGKVDITITEKTMFSRVVFSGETVQVKDFKILFSISEDKAGLAEVSISLSADMNPFLKMIVSDPANRFLEKLVEEMEKFEDWASTTE